MPSNVRTTITLQLTRKEADLIFYELTGNLSGYKEQGIAIEPEDEVSIRTVVQKIHRGLERTKNDTQYELDVLRMLAEKTQPNSPD